MKKFLTYLFAGLLFVPTFAGCAGGSDEMEISEDDGTSALPEGTSEDDYAAQMQAGEEEARGENEE